MDKNLFGGRVGTTLCGTIGAILYTADSGFTVMRLVEENGNEAIAVGTIPELKKGETLDLTGKWTSHPKYGERFQIERCRIKMPTTEEGLVAYLGSGMIKYIGPETAKNIVDAFGLRTLEILDNNIGRLVDVHGIGRVRQAQIAEEWQKQKQIRHIMMFLAGLGITPNLATKIQRQYGENTITIVRQTPYRLAEDIHGVGFLTADKIAMELGLAHDCPERIGAGILYALGDLATDGHTCYPQRQLVFKAAELLGVKPDLVTAQIEPLKILGKIVIEEDFVYIAWLYRAERECARCLLTIADTPSYIVQVVPDHDDELTDEQLEAISLCLQSKIVILTGGPGTGKTYCLRKLLDLCDKHEIEYALCCPTGRAAKRMAEATGREAQTIHRLLGFDPRTGQFNYNEDCPLPVELLVVDETSMLDISLASHLLKAISPLTHLLLVGDVDQLPSVGPGNVLRDIIESQHVPVVRLSLNFRQTEGSFIITNAHRVNQGDFPVFPRGAENDFFFFDEEDPAKAAELIVDLVCQRTPAKFGIPSTDIQVLAPMRRGEVGIEQLNMRLQAALNPPAGQVEFKAGGTTFRVGDRVMQIRNNYDLEVFNGDIGFVNWIDREEKKTEVEIDGRPIVYDFSECDELVLAYAVTIHKSQGSEYPCIVMPLLTQHYMMLQRNLVYTGITRAKELVIIVGSKKALAMAVRNNKIATRYSRLDTRLRLGESLKGGL